MAAACAPGSTMPRHTLSGTFSERPALGAISFVASAPATAASLAPAKPLPAKSASAAGSKASSIVRLPAAAPPASIMAFSPSMKASGPASAQVLPANEPAMPMNMRLSRTPLEPPMLLLKTLERQLQVHVASARGNLARNSNTLAAVVAMVEPQSASPTLPSSWSSCCLAAISAWQALSTSCATASSAEGSTPSIGSRPFTAGTGVGKEGDTAGGQVATSVGASSNPASSDVSRNSESDTPFMSSDVHNAAGPTMSLRVGAHSDLSSAAVNSAISCGGTPPKLLMSTA
mmetsp:Transcript_15182/g.35547  ORF Transcript_15182/g.35547 Transcript_15182/m.35547 type:complete len:288 (-) Transcript_15182:229-1092(-)